MISKLFSIIQRNCMNLVRYSAQQTFYRVSSISLCSSIYFVNQCKSGFSFCQRYNSLFRAIAPVTRCFLFIAGVLGHIFGNVKF
jgi:hypothetical protein